MKRCQATRRFAFRDRQRTLLSAGVLALGCLLLLPLAAGAGSTGSASLFMPAGSGAPTMDGDYISSSGGMNTSYHYFIEVPAGLARLVVEVFDADIGAGGAGEAALQHDRSRTGFNTSVTYTLLRPDGTTAVTLTCTNSGAGLCVNNAWSALLDTMTNVQAGHWELRVNQSSAVTTGSDLNAIGIRAHDGNSGAGGTELNVYADTHTNIGVNPPASGTNSRSYVLFPYITSGCSAGENDFDYDSDEGNVGSITLKSRTGAFTKTLASAALSANNVWVRNTVTGWTTDAVANDYGIWESDLTIISYVNTNGQNGNYANFYMSNFQAAANPPTANPTPNSFRTYVPNDAGTAPAKPHVEQFATYVAPGPNPPVVGMTTHIQVTVRVVNPAAQAITFSATNLVTANVPGAGAVYGGAAAVSQGTVTAQPAVGGTGNITWNPGTLAAGGTALLTYKVSVTPTSAGQRIPVTATPASGNGTTAKYVDETGNTTQARATYTFGPLCELAVTQAMVTPVVVSGVRAGRGERGGVLVEWDTSSEVGTVGFDLLRWEPREGRWVQVNGQLIPALLQASQGGHYRFLDLSAGSRGRERYGLVEHVSVPGRNEQRSYGPYELELTEPDHDHLAAHPLADAGFDRTARRPELATRSDRSARSAPSASSELLSSPAAAPASTEALQAAGRAGELAAAAVSGVRKAGGASVLEIGVRGSGLYFVAAGSIATQLGLPAYAVQALIATGRIDLTNRSGEIAWMPAGGLSGILFYGQAIDSIYTRDNIYWLRLGPGIQMRNEAGTPPSPTAAMSFRDTSHAEHEVFPATVVATDPESDYWFWGSLIAGDPISGSQTFAVDAPDIAYTPGGTFGGTAHLRVNLFGASSTGMTGEHQAAIFLNGTQIGWTTWTGIASQTADFDFDEGLLQQGGNNVQIEAQLNPGVPYSYFYVQSFDLTYPRGFQASGDALTLHGDGNAAVTAGGFNDSGVAVFDLGDPTHPAIAPYQLAAGPGATWQVTFAPATPQTPYLAVSPLGWQTPVSLSARNPQSLATPLLGADYLVITAQALLPAAQELAAYRAGQGLKTLVLDQQEIYDAFSFGIADPHAIRDLLAAARSTWNPAPRYVVLAGQGNLDYKDNLSFGGNLLPPLLVSTSYGLFASDNHLADEGTADGLPGMAIGRLPAATNADLHNLVQKIELYESAAAASWSGQALLVADNQPGGGDFAADSDLVVAALPPGYQVTRIYLDATPADQGRIALLAALQGGVGLLSYVGHGGLDRLSATGLLLASDAPNLSNGTRQPVMTALTCTINRFELPGFVPLGAALVDQSAGGAAAVWAASGVSNEATAKLLGQRFYLALARGQAAGGVRLGDVIQSALHEFAAAAGSGGLDGSGSASELVNIYELLGDPGLLVKGTPPPPGGGVPAARE
jgi:hypothetical protein